MTGVAVTLFKLMIRKDVRSGCWIWTGKVGRLLDEAGVIEHGDTEAEAINHLCRAQGLPLP